MTDKELLTFAAKACGAKMTNYSDKTPDHWISQRSDGIWHRWNPLIDDGDAFRLMVKLNINVDFDSCDQGCVVMCYGNYDQYLGETCGETFEGYGLEATRLAIVRAAAEIGSVMA